MNSPEQPNNEVPRWCVFVCVLQTCLFTLLLVTLLMTPIAAVTSDWRVLVPLWAVFGFVGFKYYPRIHATIGRAASNKAIHLSRRIDELFGTATNGRRWGEWSPETSVIFGTHWPLSAFWLVFLFAAVAIGEAFKEVWRYK